MSSRLLITAALLLLSAILAALTARPLLREISARRRAKAASAASGDDDDPPADADPSAAAAPRAPRDGPAARDVAGEAEAARLRLLSAVVESAEDPILTKTLDGIITSWNPAAERLYGYGAQEAVGQHVHLVVPPSRREELRNIMERVRLGESVRQLETIRRTRDGREVHVSLTVSPVRSRDGELMGAAAVARDISDRLQVEARLRHVLASSAAVAYVLDLTEEGGRLTWISESIRSVLGYSVEEASSSTWRRENLHPDDRERVLAELARETGESKRSLEYRLRHQDGTYHWFADETVTMRDSAGSPVETVGLLLDITARKELEAQFLQAQKMEAVGLLAGGIAHDFNNLLTAVLGSVELVREELRPTGDAAEDIDEIERAGRRAAALTRQLLAFSRRQVLQPSNIRLGVVVEGMEPLLRRLIGEDIELVVRREPGQGAVFADPNQIEQVIMNLAVNARDAMPNGGRLTIETADVELDEAYASTHLPVAPGPYVMLAVHDTGTGMDSRTLVRVFEPFFTTKEQGRGTGLGLATVYGVVKQSGGSIWPYSEEGVGTTFKIYLPRVAGGEVVAAGPAEGGARGGDETILLVEDDDAVRRIARVVLERRGYTVLEAADGENAVRLASAHGGPIDLVVTDIVMPGLGGPALLERLRDLRPDIPVLFTSGYTSDAVIRHGVETAETPFLQKPFTAEALARKVREVIERA